MKTIKVFLASSEELEMERLQFDSLFNHLNRIFRPRGIYLELSKWEYLDSSMGPKHKQEEYNEELKTCEMCMVLYWTKFGEYTHQELMTAYNELKEGRNPRKLYIFFKETGEITPELQSFKESFATEFGHFYCKFENVDTMRLHFLLQLEAYQTAQMKEVLTVEDSKLKVDGQAVVELDKVPFAAKNRRFQELKADIERIELEIKTFEGILAAGPNPAIQDLLAKKRSELYGRKKELSEHEGFLFNTAVRIAQQQGEKLSGRMSRAIQAFEDGRAGDANVILEEALHDAKELRQEIARTKELLKAQQENAAISISELLLKTTVVLADDDLPVEKRIEAAHETFKEAYALANESDYEQRKYMDLLEEYEKFLSGYGMYKECRVVQKELLDVRLSILGQEHTDVAKSYNNIGSVFMHLGDISNALEYHQKALRIWSSVYDECHPAVSTSYNNIGLAHFHLGAYSTALEYLDKALNIRLAVYGETHHEVAVACNNMGIVHSALGEYSKALGYYERALRIKLSVYGEKHPEIALIYNNIAKIHSSLGAYSTALEYMEKSLDIRLAVYGGNHPDVATSYNNIGYLKESLGSLSEALEYYERSLNIRLAVYGGNHPDVAVSYNNLGYLNESLGAYSKALEYHEKALDLWLSVYGGNHPNVATSYNNIGLVYSRLGEYRKSLEYHLKSLDIRLAVYGGNHPDVALSCNNIGYVHHNLGAYSESMKYHKKALEIRLSVYGEKHPDVAMSCINIGSVHSELGECSEALEYYEKTLSICLPMYGEKHQYVLASYNNIARLNESLGDYAKALEYFEKTLKVALLFRSEEDPKVVSLKDKIDNLKASL